ncbi:MAG TPA: lysylphosphatidylglycerol synthase domain-containing protein [Polyangia bacterium]|nr:lysylphosphatidylglycerol synthase domain-containing protein [Polyangia bacterium]
MRSLLFVGLVFGIGLLAGLGWVVHGPLLAGALAMGFWPVLAASAYRVPTLAIYAWSWRLLLPAAGRPRFTTLWRLRWIGESVNSLLPAAQIGGDLVRAQLVAAQGVDGGAAAAALVADVAVGTLTQALFGIAGLLAFAAVGLAGELGRSIALGSLLLLAAAAAMLGVLHVGAGRVLARIPLAGRLGTRAKTLAGGVAATDAGMKALIRRPRALVASAGWHFLGWLSHVGETWLVLALCGARVSWTAALAIESLSATVRAAAFFVPGGIGVQEGTLVYLCRHLGVPLEPALALGLVKRFREIVVGVPGLVAWALAERAPLDRRRPRGRLSESCDV